MAFELNLKSLKIFHANYLDDCLQLNFPKIYFLSFGRYYVSRSFSVLNFKHPCQYEQIIHLRCEYYYGEWVQKLKNLKVLVCKNYGYRKPIGNLLACHPKLKCLHFNYCALDQIGPIIDEAKKLNRMDDLEFYVLSYRPDGRPFNHAILSPNWLTQEKVDHYMEEPSRLAPTIPFINALVFDNENGSFNRLDAAFYAKLVDLQKMQLLIRSSRQEQLINLIKHFKNIVQIGIYRWTDENLDNFYALLPKYCPYLRVLEVDNSNISFFDLRFAFKLPELYCFRFYKQLCHQVDYLFLRLKLKLKQDKIRMINEDFDFDERYW